MNNKLEFEYVETKKLVPYVRNAKTHSETQIKKIMGSIKEFGFIAPIIIDKDNNVLAGHGRLLAADRLGLEKVPCIKEDHLTETQRKAYILADNRIGELAGWDDELLKIELEELQENDFDIDVIGFEDDILKAIEDEEEEEKEEKADIPFTEELLEEHNYVVLYFDNEVDWLQAKSLFELETKRDVTAPWRSGKGIGRVLKGAETLEKLQKIFKEIG